MSRADGRLADLAGGELRVLVVDRVDHVGRRELHLERSGHALRDFFSESLFELRKVVWPTRQETIQTTLVIMVVVIILSILLGLIDLFLNWSILQHLLKLGR